MTTETKEVTEKYDVTIQRRATELCDKLGITEGDQKALIHTTLKETGLESWKNGRNRGESPKVEKSTSSHFRRGLVRHAEERKHRALNLPHPSGFLDFDRKVYRGL